MFFVCQELLVNIERLNDWKEIPTGNASKSILVAIHGHSLRATAKVPLSGRANGPAASGTVGATLF